MINNAELKTIIDKARVARLATVNSECRPHLIPVVFTFDGEHYYIPIDKKTKREPSKPEKLRVKNIHSSKSKCCVIYI